MNNKIDELCINAIRMTSMDLINKAKSGHPGIALGAAPIMHTLYTRHLNSVTSNSKWLYRDRFILSAGHGSSMLYSTLHLAGFDISVDELKNFRQFGSKTPGHPESHLTDGIDATTGPLGQGIAMGVGFAIGMNHLSEVYKLDDEKLFKNYTYVLCGDGCLQEGVALEALSVAGSLGVNNLIILFDSNDIQLDGPVGECQTQNVKNKFESIGFYYDLVKDGTSVDDIDNAITKAKNQNKPAIIEIKTVIGFGSDVAGKSAAHGSPLGEEKTKALAKNLNWNYSSFEIPAECYELYKNTFSKRSNEFFDQTEKLVKEFCAKSAENKAKLALLSKGVKVSLSDLEIDQVAVATRNSSGIALKEVLKQNPLLIGGSADVANATKIKGADGNFNSANKSGRNILFGVREHAMGAIVNGLTMVGLKGFGSTFFAFSDYMKPTLKMAALMEIPSVFIYSHDSLAVGEDGPTHQPIEHIAMLRSIPNFNVIRPASTKEVYQAFELAFNATSTPTAILTTRQDLEYFDSKDCDVSKGAYVALKETKDLKMTLIATGSEVSLAIAAVKLLGDLGKHLRVVSMPSTYLYDKQTADYKATIIPKNSVTVAVEMASPLGWYKYATHVYAVDTFGVSAPYKDVLNHFGFTPEKLKDYLLTLIK